MFSTPPWPNTSTPATTTEGYAEQSLQQKTAAAVQYYMMIKGLVRSHVAAAAAEHYHTLVQHWA